MPEDRVVIDLPTDWSDGDPAAWDGPGYISKSDDLLYHDKIADMWMKHTKQAQPGVKYRFSKLPRGYAIYVKPRKDSVTVDRYLLGHKHGRFDSPNKFFDHARYIFSNGTTKCTCVNCVPKRATSRASLPGKVRNGAGRPKKAGIFDEEDLNAGQFRLDVLLASVESEENGQFTSMLWPEKPSAGDLIPSASFSSMAEAYERAQSFEPRKGELVLFYENSLPSLRLDPLTQQFSIYSGASQTTGGRPPWRVGIVAQTPATRLTLDDLISSRRTDDDKTNPSLFVIEIYDSLASRGGSISSQISYVGLDHIRPFSMIHELLSGQSQDTWHSSIKNAFNVLDSVCFVNPKSIKTRWPMAHVSCRGAWIGAELIIVNDVVRLLPKSSQEPIDTVMHVHDIRLEFDRSIGEGVANAHFIGTLYSLNKSDLTRGTPLSAAELAELPKSMNGYSWYLREDSRGKSLFRAALSTIAGRCFEQLAMVSMIAIEDLDFGVSVRRGRSWAAANDPERLNLTGSWRLTNDRSEALKLEALGGAAIGRGRQREKLRTLLHENGSDDWENQSNQSASHKRPLAIGVNAKSAVVLEDDDQMEFPPFSDLEDYSDNDTVKAFVQEAINDGIMLPPLGAERESGSDDVEGQGEEVLDVLSDDSRASKRLRI